MNELTKEIVDIGDTKSLAYTFDAEPSNVTVVVEKGGFEVLRVSSPGNGISINADGNVSYDYVVTGEHGTGRYSFRIFATGDFSDAFEDFFYVRKSAFANPLASED